MPVSCIIHGRPHARKLLRAAALGLVVSFVTKAAVAKDATPVRVPLEPLGFEQQKSQFLLAGSSMMTLDFVDDSHLLLTYNVKRLLKRLPDCPPSDEDHMVEAVLISLPDGREMARGSWRLHDRGQYLWKLGKGRFLLRTGDSLSTIAPLLNHASGDTFRQQPLLNTNRRIGGVVLSPDSDLLIVETLEPRRPAGLEEATGARPASQTDEEKLLQQRPVQINFFTLRYGSGDQIELLPGEATRVRELGRIPANSAGFLSILDEGDQHWAFDFNTYDGKKIELSPFDSTCRPSPLLVSRAEFIAFGCHLSHTPQVIGGFNLRGEQMWEQNMMETYTAPTFSYAPAAGRFAMSRMLTHTSLVTDGAISPELVAGQSIVVYQASTGNQLLHVNATPVARAGQNYALSPDGLGLAVIRTDAIEVYHLPEVSKADRAALAKAEAAAPMLGNIAKAKIATTQVVAMPSSQEDEDRIRSTSTQQAPAADSARSAAAAAPAQPSPTPAAPSEAILGNAEASGQPEPTPAGDEPRPRKPPTLYNEPGEHPKESPQ